METILILVRQIAQMFLLAGMGYLLFKSKRITQEGSRALGNILIYLALPAVIVNGFLVERTPERLAGMLYSAVGAVALLLLSILIARFFFKQDAIAAFAGAFSNPGFFGVPLIEASLGQGAVFYVACFIAFLNIGQWTYGVSILNGQPIRQGLAVKKLIRAPFIIAILIGLFLFLTQIKLPSFMNGCLSTVAGINTPLSMFTVGVYLAQTCAGDVSQETSILRFPGSSDSHSVYVPVVFVPFAGNMARYETCLAAGCRLPGWRQRGGICATPRQGLSIRCRNRSSLHALFHAFHPRRCVAFCSFMVRVASNAIVIKIAKSLLRAPPPSP